MLLDRLQADLAAAQKARDQIKVDTLRFLLGAVFNLQIEKYPPSKGGPPAGGLTDPDILSVIKKQVKTHGESIEMFEKAKRTDLVSREKAELSILLGYLPAQVDESEVRNRLKEIRDANPEADFGTLMKLAMAKLGGTADGATVARILKEPISS